MPKSVRTAGNTSLRRTRRGGAKRGGSSLAWSSHLQPHFGGFSSSAECRQGLMRISVIIPCWNDEAALEQCLRAVTALRGIDEIIVADASDSDSAVRIARQAGARTVRCDMPNRGRQLNAGAALASGDMLFFQHVDAELTQAHVDSLCAAAARNGIVGGAFHRKFDPRHRLRQWLVPIVRRYNCRFGALYGDQTIFTRRSQFLAMGGFADIPLMEDVEFSRRLRKAGPIAL